jgi:hypothetical protein
VKKNGTPHLERQKKCQDHIECKKGSCKIDFEELGKELGWEESK